MKSLLSRALMYSSFDPSPFILALSANPRYNYLKFLKSPNIEATHSPLFKSIKYNSFFQYPLFKSPVKQYCPSILSLPSFTLRYLGSISSKALWRAWCAMKLIWDCTSLCCGWKRDMKLVHTSCKLEYLFAIETRYRPTRSVSWYLLHTIRQSL